MHAPTIVAAISDWLVWAEERYGEEFVYISEELIPDLANYIIIRNTQERG